MSKNYETTLGRAALALLAGACAGDLIITLAYIVRGLRFADLLSYNAYGWSYLGSEFYRAFVLMFVEFSFGLLLIGAPFWWFFHRLGWRRLWQAVALGGILPPGVVLLAVVAPTILNSGNSTFSAGDASGPEIVDNHFTAHGWANLFRDEAILMIAGIVVGALIWRIAYRHTTMKSHE